MLTSVTSSKTVFNQSSLSANTTTELLAYSQSYLTCSELRIYIDIDTCSYQKNVPILNFHLYMQLHVCTPPHAFSYLTWPYIRTCTQMLHTYHNYYCPYHVSFYSQLIPPSKGYKYLSTIYEVPSCLRTVPGKIFYILPFICLHPVPCALCPVSCVGYNYLSTYCVSIGNNSTP